jgi:hypothetical protein
MERTKRLIFYVLIITLPVLGFQCRKCTPEQRTGRALLILIDKSASVQSGTPAEILTVKSKLKPVIEEAIRQAGDQILIKLIHGTSVGAESVLRDSFSQSVPCDQGQRPSAYKKEQNAYAQALAEFQEKILEKVVTQLKSTTQGAASNQTDLLGTLEVASEFFKQTTASAPKTIVYISDMVHSQPQPRDYFLKPLKSKAEADSCALLDWQWASKQRNIDARVFEGSKIHIWFPSTQMQLSQNEWIKYYWIDIFRHLNPGIQVMTNLN